MTAWPMVPLGEVVERVQSGRPVGPEFTYVDLSAVDAKRKTIAGARRIPIDEAPSRARQHIRAGDVLVATVRPNLNGVAAVSDALTGAIASTGFTVLRSGSRLDPRYLFHWVQSPSFVKAMSKKATGASYPAVSDSIVKSSLIPLPPLTEQRRIAAILDAAAELQRRRRDTLGAEAQTSLFHSMLSAFPNSPTVGLLEVTKLHSGGTPSKQDSSNWIGDVPWFSPKDLKADDLWDATDHISEAAASKLKAFPADSVALVVRGMILAHTVPISVLRVPSTINQDMKVIEPVVGLDPQYLAAALRAQSRVLLSAVSSAGHGTKRLDTQALAAVKIPLLPHEGQRKFGAANDVLQRRDHLVDAHLDKLDELFASLQYRAFRGEL